MRRVLRGIGLVLAAIVLLALAALVAIDSGPGHRLLADRIGALKPPTGLRIRIGRIDGSIWGQAVLRDVALADLDGIFFRAPEIRLAWRPLGWLDNRLEIDSLTADSLTLARLPRLRSTGAKATLPSFDVHVGRLAVGRAVLGAGVAGRATVARLSASADLRDQAAAIAVDLATRLGDRARVRLDAAPDADRFDLAARIAAPAGGVVAGLAGVRRDLAVDVGGEGGWRRWRGRARATLGGRPVAGLALRVDDGRVALAGRMVPASFLQGKLQRLTAPQVAVQGEGRFADRRLSGRLRMDSPALRIAAAGTIDLTENRFEPLTLDATLLRPAALFPNMSGRDIHLAATLAGPFDTARFRYRLTAPRVAFDATGFEDVAVSGAGQFSAAPVRLSIAVAARRVTGVGEAAGGILGRLRVVGMLAVTPTAVTGRNLTLASDQLAGRLGLDLDLVTGRYAVSLSGGLRRYLIPGLGLVEVTSEVRAVPGPGGRGTVVAGRGRAWVRRLDNAFFATLAGGLPRIDTGVVRAADGSIRFPGLVLTAPSIRIAGEGLRRVDGTFRFAGRGTQAQYGAFTIELDGDIAKPKVALRFDAPLDALGLADVSLTLDPVAEGFAMAARGQSTLGPFAAAGRILLPPGGVTSIEIGRLAVSGTQAAGTLRSDPGGFTGTLAVAGGGIDGRIGFRPENDVQRIDLALALTEARLAAAQAVAVRRGRIEGMVRLDPAGTTLAGKVAARGLASGAVRLARLEAEGALTGGRGRVSASLSGSRGRSFRLTGQADVAPDRIAVTGGGTIDQQPLTLVEGATLTAEGAGWRLAPTRLRYAGGGATVSARFGGGPLAAEATLDRIPLSILDMAAPELGLGGSVSGRVAVSRADAAAMPAADARITVRGLMRTGLVLSSVPADVGLVARLNEAGLAARAVATSGGRTIGRAQMRIAPPAATGTLAERLARAPLFAQLRYNGAADTLWRLIGIETIDLSGPVGVAADVGGTLADPAIRGLLRTDAARLESAVTGTVITDIAAAGRFTGSTLVLDRMAGATAEGGKVQGRGQFGFSGARGFTMDLALDADEAQLLNRDDIGATVTGPLTLKLGPDGGTIGGDVVLDRSRFRLGSAAAAEIPRLPVTEINRPADEAEDEAPAVPWKLALKARAPNRLMVRGLGLDSEWRADLTIGGDVENPAIGGRAVLMRGGYQFAGRRFDLDRGTIRFTGVAPADPILDIVARAGIQGLTATIHVTGTGQRPDIAFESIPALPEDELLSRLLFGTSITNLSAPEAVQLAAAVASLRDGGGGGLGLDPINAIRRATGLDRLRILPADATTGQGTSVAAGKYIGRRTYVELITDGAGYSATRVEFQITRWLSVLSTISTIGRQSANVRVSRDY